MNFRWLMIRRALLQKRAKTLLIIAAVAMSSSVVAALLNLEVDLRSRMNRELRDYGPNVVLMAAEANRSAYLDDSILEPLKAGLMNHVILLFTPQLFVPAKCNGIQTIIAGSHMAPLRQLYPGWRWSSNEDGAFVGIRLAQKAKLIPGQTATIEVNRDSKVIRIAGTVESGEAADDQLFLSLPEAQALAHKEGEFQIVSVSALGSAADVDLWFQKLVASHPDVKYGLIRRIAQAEASILDKISRLMSLVIGIIFVILFFCINTTVSAILLARRSEIALFRALGARRREIMRGLTMELLTLALVGGILGFAGGMAMSQVLGRVLFQTWVLPHAWIFPVTIISSLAMVVISSILPIHSAVNREAALVLKEA